MDRLRLETEQVAGVTVAHLEGEIDKLAVDQARSRLDPLAAGGRLILDLDRVSFIDSAGLHALFGLGRVAASHGGRLALSVSAASPAARVIAIVHLADVMPVCGTVAEAVRALDEVSDPPASG